MQPWARAARTFTAVSRLTQPCIRLASLNGVPASAGIKAGNVISVGWQVTLDDYFSAKTKVLDQSLIQIKNPVLNQSSG